jgi:hypothetical protein
MVVSERSQVDTAVTGEHHQLTRLSALPAPTAIPKLISRRRQVDLLPPDDYRESKILEHSDWQAAHGAVRQARDRDASVALALERLKLSQHPDTRFLGAARKR